MKRTLYAALGAALFALASCASEPPAVPDYSALPPVDTSFFVQTDGTRFRAPDGSPWVGRGVAFGNAVWSNPQSAADFQHHRMSDYRVLKEMGFNSVRFYINYALFESDNRPYRYKQSGFDWIDRNIEAARAEGIRLILNMHYPQGGFQSNGNGDALWTNRANQDRLVALWKEIAFRYRAEPVIIGYGPVNEPVPVHGMNEWEALLQRIIDAIREVDSHHIIFAERAIWLKNGHTDEIRSNLEFPQNITDPAGQLALEFHFYDPMPFTHQNTSWTSYNGLNASWPDENRLDLRGGRWASFAEAGQNMASGTFDWREAGGTLVRPDRDEWLVAYPVLQAHSIGTRGSVWIDRIVVEESADNGETFTTVKETPGNTENGWDFWSHNKSGAFSLSRPDAVTGNRLSVSGTTGDANITWRQGGIFLEKGKTYRFSARLKGRNIAKDATVRLRLDFYTGEAVRVWNRAYLEDLVDSYVEHAKNRDLPLYLGEFGLAADAFEEGRGGLQWIEEMLDILVSRNITYNYHTWRESAFGIFRNNVGYADPAQAFKPLVETFTRLQNSEEN